jgi:probable rRNA maturation factor
MSIEVLDESGQDLDVRHLASLSRFVLDRMRVHPLAELCIKAVDEETIAGLNAQWMDKEGVTDVLAFPMDELRPGLVNEEPEEGVLGDLVLCPAVAERQGETAGHGTLAEVELLTVHGILHLLGYDHAEPGEKAEMFGLQDRLLAEWRALDEKCAPPTCGWSSWPPPWSSSPGSSRRPTPRCPPPPGRVPTSCWPTGGPGRAG